jgi:hypothetical protein
MYGEREDPTKLTKRDVILDVANRWLRQYDARIKRGEEQWTETHRRLLGLDLATATPEDVQAVIGNASWTRMECEVCDAEVEELVLFDGKARDEYGRTQICRGCAEKILSAFRKVG